MVEILSNPWGLVTLGDLAVLFSLGAFFGGGLMLWVGFLLGARTEHSRRSQGRVPLELPPELARRARRQSWRRKW